MRLDHKDYRLEFWINISYDTIVKQDHLLLWRMLKGDTITRLGPTLFKAVLCKIETSQDWVHKYFKTVLIWTLNKASFRHDLEFEDQMLTRK